MMSARAVVVYPGGVSGVVRTPPSKSYTHRAFLAALLASGTSTVENPLWSSDTLATLEAVRALGAEVQKGRDRVVVVSPGPGGLRWTPCIDAGESGTTMRLVTGVLGLLDKPVLVYGSGRLHERPVRPLLEALAVLGARYLVSRGCCPPHVVQGPVTRGHTVVDARESSQYLSALLFLGAGLGELEISVAGLESRPYVDITVVVLEAFGARVKRRDYSWFAVRGSPRPTRYRIPGDWSSAAALLAAGVIAGKVRVEDVYPWDPQPDKAIIDVLRGAGAHVKLGEDYAEAERGRLEGFETCIRDYPDLGPVLAALAATACSVSRICCAERLRLKESNRVEAILDVLHRGGVEARLTRDSDKGLCIEVRGRCGKLPGGVTYSTHGDHRVAMLAALLGLASEKPVKILDHMVVAKSFPDFWDALGNLGVRIDYEH